jgi:hypothetical protein
MIYYKHKDDLRLCSPGTGEGSTTAGAPAGGRRRENDGISMGFPQQIQKHGIRTPMKREYRIDQENACFTRKANGYRLPTFVSEKTCNRYSGTQPHFTRANLLGSYMG